MVDVSMEDALKVAVLRFIGNGGERAKIPSLDLYEPFFLFHFLKLNFCLPVTPSRSTVCFRLRSPQ